MSHNTIVPVFMLVMCLTASVRAADGNSIDNGKRLYEAACLQCHTGAAVEQTRDGRSGWEDTVHKMVVIGAQLDAEEMEQLIDFLAREYGPAGEPMRTGALPPDAALTTAEPLSSEQIELPRAPGRQLVEAYCMQCHDAGRIVTNRRDSDDWRRYTVNMLAQGDMAVADTDIELMAGYLTKHFGFSE